MCASCARCVTVRYDGVRTSNLASVGNSTVVLSMGTPLAGDDPSYATFTASSSTGCAPDFSVGALGMLGVSAPPVLVCSPAPKAVDP